MKTLRMIVAGGGTTILVVLSVSSIALACQIGWSGGQPSQAQADSYGYFSFDLETTFEADSSTCHTVYFDVANPTGNNITDEDITPDTFTNKCSDNGLSGGAWHLLDTVNEGYLIDSEENGLLKTNCWASPGLCSGEHQCAILYDN